ncbi:hypothetical protein [Bosea sp. (in: a-proteobacteria)]|uniref:hypothetical protein n=1 Tax=Bosea sp. (in: a-proteobacteria) TaxID=1871050 RepID=UPI003F6F471C
MAEKLDDIELKFDGDPVKRLDGAPADAVIASLNALQRMIYIIGMRSEGRTLSERLKPTAKVKREYAVVCRAPISGSHVQPFNVASQSGQYTASAVAAREKLLKTLKAFDSGKEELVEQALPNARERWFMAKAALGLIPPEDSGLEVTVRTGSRGPFSFKADRARIILSKYQTGNPPDADEDIIAGKLRAIDYGQTILTIKPSHDPAFRMDYPLLLEKWLQANVRRRLKFSGKPKINQKGDVSSFKDVYFATELEPTLEPIHEFRAGTQNIQATRPLSIPVTVDWQDRVFAFRDKELGIDAYAESYSDLRQNVLDELDVLWRQYALAPNDELDSEAQLVKVALLARFKGATE